MEPADNRHQVVIGVGPLDVVQHHRKDVRSDTGHAVVVTAAALDAVRHDAQDVVAKIRGEGIVDGAEAVDIQEGDGKHVVRALRRVVDIHLELLEEELAVVHTRQGILVSVIVLLAFHRRRAHAFPEETDQADGAALFIELRAAANREFLGRIRSRNEPQRQVEGAVLVQGLRHFLAEHLPVGLDDATLERLERIVHLVSVNAEELGDAVRPINLPRRHVERPESIAGRIDHHLEHFVLLDQVFLEIAAGFYGSHFRDIHVVAQLPDVRGNGELVEQGQVKQDADGEDIVYNKKDTSRETDDFRNKTRKNNTCKQ